MFYKINHGFSSEDYVEIDESEVAKAFYCFLEKKDSIFSGGAIRGSNIISIKPDFHRTMGWNRGHKMDEYDFAELKDKGVDRKMQMYLESEKEKVQYLVKTNQPHLIGTKFDLPKVQNPLSKEIKELAESKKII